MTALRSRPTADELALIDPDRRFFLRLAADREAVVRLTERGDRSGLQRLVHALAGAAGTFGHAEIGDRAIALDELLTAREDGPPDISDEQIRTAVDGLLAALADIDDR